MKEEVIDKAFKNSFTRPMNSHSKTRRVLLLWSPLADYTVACFRKLAERKEIELYLVCQAVEKDAPYAGFDLSYFKKVWIYRKEEERKIEAFCTSLAPDVIMMASWNYSFYMSVAKKCKRNGSYIISTFDGQWRATLKQGLGILISPFFLKPAIDNFFVPGDRQANFARKLGYNNPLQGYYSAFTDRFNNISGTTTSHKFLFIGRLVSIKGIENLIAAYKEYRRVVKDPLPLIIFGTGKSKSFC